MAPMSRNNAANNGPNGQVIADGAFEAPSSTMAAALINNISTSKAPQLIPQDDLHRVMSEVSSRENNIEELTESEKLEHKHKLIYVFVRAVLERLSRDAPFNNVETLIDQALEALDILISTVREVPDVLLHTLNPETSLHSRGQEPLWLWLFPRLLTLLGRRNCERLTDRIKECFRVVFQVVTESPKLWDLSSLFFYYLKECVTTLLVALDSPSIVHQGRMSEIALPLKDADLSVFLQRQDELPATPLSQYIARDPVEAFRHVTELLSIIGRVLTVVVATCEATPSFQDYLTWMFDSFGPLQGIYSKWEANPGLHHSVKSSAVTMFETLHALPSGVKETLPAYVLRNAYMTLAGACAILLDSPDELAEPLLNNRFCLCMLNLAAVCRDHESVRRAVNIYLGPPLHIILIDDDTNTKLGPDFQTTTKTLLEACMADEALNAGLTKAAVTFKDNSLSLQFQLLGLNQNDLPHVDIVPPAKRRKILAAPDLYEDIVGRLFSLLGSQTVTDLDGLSQVAASHFARLDNEDRCKAIELLGMLPCAAYGSLTVLSNERGHVGSSRCSVCNETPGSKHSDANRCRAASSEAIATLTNLVEAPSFLETKRLRVQAMITLTRFTSHFKDDEFLDLKVSQLGQWCLQSLKSSIRELRVAAGRTLPGFLKDPDNASRQNRSNVIGILHSLSEQNIIHLQETCVLAWGQLGRILTNEELNPVLLKLVHYLGHTNPVVAAAAYNEILKLSKLGKRPGDKPVERLLSPYWSSVAILAVKDLLVRPQTVQHLADLLEMTVPRFLILTQSFTLPWLVLWKHKDVIQKIVRAREDDEAWETCMDPSNLVPILALLLAQPISNMDDFVLSLMNGVSRRFVEQKLDLMELLKVEPATTALHLLRAAGEAEREKKPRIRYGMQILAARAQSASDVGGRRRNNSVEAFLEEHILGLVARVSEVVNDTRDERSVLDKRIAVKAVEEMALLGKQSIRLARPQICALLQSVLAQTELQAVAFSAWACMLRNLEDDDVEMMLESTFSIIIQHWSSFDYGTKFLTEDALQYLLKDRARLIRINIINLPSLGPFPELVDVARKLNDLRRPTDVSNAFQIFRRRIRHENSGVVAQVLYELKNFLKDQQAYLQSSAVSEQPDVVIGQLVRAILDACVKFNESHHDIARLSAECIGMIGCLDPNRVETLREQSEMIVVHNFEEAEETVDFVIFLLKEVIVKAFLSATDTAVQGFLSFVMQELLDRIQFKDVCTPIIKHGEKAAQNSAIYRKWLALPESVQTTLTPFLTSRYSLAEMTSQETHYPIFPPDKSGSGKVYNKWLRTFVLDLLLKPFNVNASLVFTPLCRAIRIKDLSVASFLLPYVVLHGIVKGSDQDRQNISSELFAVLNHSVTDNSQVKAEDAQFCIEAVFRVLDYLSRWVQEKQSYIAQGRITSSPAENGITTVENILGNIDAEVISQRAIECKAYSRALFNWEQHIRNLRGPNKPRSESTLLQQLQYIYTQIDEPDGIEGISAHLHVLDVDQQILGHRKAGRWTAAQTWYEIQLAEMPENLDTQVNLLTCLKESGQHDVLLNYVEGMHTQPWTVTELLPYATEASWATGRWLTLDKYTRLAPKDVGEDFNISIGRSLLALYNMDTEGFQSSMLSLREQIAGGMSKASTSSFGAARNSMLKLHVLTELEMIAGVDDKGEVERDRLLESLERRLEMIGGFLSEKQYLLGIRRAAMQLSSLGFTEQDVAAAWLTSARLARKGNAMHQSFNAVLHALKLGDDSATIEQARLLWKDGSQDGNQRKAIQILQGAISSNAFISHDRSLQDNGLTGVDKTQQQNLLTARAHLLLAKWLDSAGQTQSSSLREQYQKAATTYSQWEKGHYYLGRHYNKLLESEKALPPERQADVYITGTIAQSVIMNYLRAISYGTKYLYQTLPRILTLWLDLGVQVNQAISEKHATSREAVANITSKRKKILEDIHSKLQRYVHKLPAYIFYTALPQIVARITHPNPEVYKHLKQMVMKVVSSHPQHAMWSLMAMSISMQSDRRTHGLEIMTALRDIKGMKSGSSTYDYKSLIQNGSKLTEQLLLVCNNGDFHGNRTHRAKIKDLGFNPKTCTPSHLTVPIESVLTASLPTLTDNLRSHQAFSRDVVTIAGFDDDVLVLSSLAKPKKLTALGSDGRKYGLLCKPKDDLRKDQRLMEFNSMINRSLKRDAESSRRQLYIKTYAVTPLNEECGVIEWVEGLKTLRDILLALYKSKCIYINYTEIAAYCEEAIKGPEKLPFFTEKVLGQFPPVFHLWFVQQFPEPSAWFAARLRYTRSCAVMSMVGTILGLGDRHGENILFQEGNGGTFHVDFNCLFDKGLTFTKPERVPFRLTHNMADAMGIYGYEGPFRKSSELTLKLLRQHEATLMTILEAFVYDPTLDLVKKADKRRREGHGGVPDTAQGVLDSIQRKLRGLLAGESVPLSVEGQVEELIQQATNPMFLAGMYIGWCNFL